MTTFGEGESVGKESSGNEIASFAGELVSRLFSGVIQRFFASYFSVGNEVGRKRGVSLTVFRYIRYHKGLVRCKDFFVLYFAYFLPSPVVLKLARNSLAEEELIERS